MQTDLDKESTIQWSDDRRVAELSCMATKLTECQKCNMLCSTSMNLYNP